MKVAIAGLGLIGGSLFKAFAEAGVDVTGFDRDDPVDVAGADVVFVALHPAIAVDWIARYAAEFKDGAIVADTCGVKGFVMDAVARIRPPEAKWRFVGCHPMAGKETSGFKNSDAGLFRGASVIFVPQVPGGDEDAIETLSALCHLIGFKKTVVADAAEHDSKIAYTSQLCHIISSAYLRDPLAYGFDGFSAGSFRDMVRVGAPDPKLWSELFDENREALLPVLDRLISRLSAMRGAIASGDVAAVVAQLAEGKPIKDKIYAGQGGTARKPLKGTKAWREAMAAATKAGGSEAISDEWQVPKGQ